MRKEKQELSIEIKGIKYTGYRIISWTQTGEMHQLIHYKMQHVRKDVRRYKTGQEKIMESVARLLLEELVREAEAGK